MEPEETHLVRTEPAGSAFSMWVGFGCALVGLVALISWYGHVAALRTLGSWSLAMRPVSALALVVGGAAMSTRALVRAPRYSRALAAICSALGLLGFADRLDPSHRIASWFVAHVLHIPSASALPPMAPGTSVCLVFVGIGILLTWRRPVPMLASMCAFVTALPPAAILAAYVYGLRLDSVADRGRMSLPTAIALLGLASALWWLRGRESSLRVLTASGPGGSLARRLVPVAIIVPLFLGWPRVVTLRNDLFGPTVSIAVGQVEVAVLLAVAVVWAAVSIDRTEKRRREAAALSEHRGVQLAKAQRIARVGSFQRDIASGRSEWSEELYRLLGYRVGEITPSFDAFLDRVEPADRARVAKAISRSEASGEPFRIEFSILLPDGTRSRIEAQGDIDKPDGETRLIGVAQDVTEQRRVADALRESEDRYRIIIEAAAEGIWVSNARGRTSLVNPRMSEMLGYSAEELSSLPLTTFLKDEGEGLLQRVRSRRRAGVVDRYEVELIRKDGSTFWVSVTANPLRSSSGEFLGTLALIRDISARKEAEEALRDAYDKEREALERLRSIDDMKDAFLAAVSHELRTPLTGVLGFAATLQQRDADLTDQERAMITERLLNNAQRLQRLLSDLLDLDRLKRGSMTPYRRLVNVDELARGVAEHVDTAGHILAIDVEADLAAFLDAPKVERIIENLLTNAVRHTTVGSRIWLSAGTVDGGLVIAVEDDGPGVDERSRSKIFEPFQTGQTTKPYSPGTGIGLSLVLQFAKLHGGRAWLEDRPGGGSSFKVFLPLGEADAVHLSTGVA
jgi:PAS domain S-box-containing protein